MMKNRWTQSILLAGVIVLTSRAHAQQNLIPELFPGIQIGSVVQEDGTIVRTQAFALDSLAPAIVVQNLQTQQQSITGNSTFNYGASADSFLVSLAFELGGLKTFGAASNISNTTSSSTQAQNIEMTSLLVGTNRLAFIDFQRLSPNSFLETLNSALLQENSSLQRIATGIQDLTLLLETTPDVNSPVARQIIANIAEAKEEFKRNYGVGFVSSVILGGAAAVRGEFASRASSAQVRWNGSGRLYGAGTGGRFELSTAIGTMNSNQLAQSSFEVTSSALGGPTYIAFANQFRDQFANRGITELWNRNLAQLPSTEGLLGSPQPNLPPFTTPPSRAQGLAAKFGAITNADQLKLYTNALAFDRWNKEERNGQGTFEEFEAFQDALTEEVGQTNPGDVLVPNENEAQNGDNAALQNVLIQANRLVASTPARKSLLLKDTPRVEEPMQITGLGAEPLPSPIGGLQASLFPDVSLLLSPAAMQASILQQTASQAAFQQSYWNAVQGDFEVIAVEITRWEDVIPGFGFSEALINNTLAGRDFVESQLVLQTFRYISNMYSIASSCSVNVGSTWFESRKYLALANAFLRYEDRLRQRIAGQADPLPIVRDFLANLPLTSQAIYQVFILNRDLFSVGEVGMGGYGVYRNLMTRADLHARFEGLRNLQPRGNGVRFNTRFGWARNTALALHAPEMYETAVKFFPLLEPEIENFVADGENSRYNAKIRLMASTFDPQGNGTAINGFLVRRPNQYWLFSSGENEEVIEIPLEDVQEVTNFGSQEFVLPIPGNLADAFVLNSEDFTAEWLSKRAIEEFLFRRAERHRLEAPPLYRLKEIRLKPFTVADVAALRNWRGFIAYEQRTLTLLEEFWQEVSRSFIRIANGDNYFTRVFPNGRIVDLNRAFNPADLAQFTSYMGLINRPSTFAPRR